MSAQLDLFEAENLEAKDDVFYVRCRKRIKKALLLESSQDGFNSTADWFDQWVPKAIKLMREHKNAASKKANFQGRNRALKKTKHKKL